MSILKSTNRGLCGIFEKYLKDRHYIRCTENFTNSPKDPLYDPLYYYEMWYFSTLDGKMLGNDYCIRKVPSRFAKSGFIYFVIITLKFENNVKQTINVRIKDIQHIKNIEKYWNMCMHVGIMHYIEEREMLNKYAQENIIDYKG